MQKLALGVILCAGWIQGQAFEELLLPSARRIKGVVVDEDGNPVVGAEIHHSSNPRRLPTTQMRGEFDLETRAPVLVIRKKGYESRVVRTEESATRITLRRATEGESEQTKTEESQAVRITLRKIREVRRIPACPGSRQSPGNAGLFTSFVFPRVPEVSVGRLGHDVDYTVRYYTLKTKKGRKGIQHGWGYAWSFGLPLDSYVWESAKYEETRYENDGVAITDARGQTSDGRRWRSLGKLGESATYDDVDEATAKVLDRLLDGVCLRAE